MANVPLKKRHGDWGTRLYRTWQDMKNRCNNPNSKDYKDYGGRGIKVCEEWANSYIEFKKWSLNNNYSDDLTIERINVNEGYKPQNCKFIPIEEQYYNKRNTIYLNFDGKKLNVKEWSIITGLTKRLILNRKQRGWSDEEILTVPIGGKRNGRK